MLRWYVSSISWVDFEIRLDRGWFSGVFIFQVFFNAIMG